MASERTGWNSKFGPSATRALRQRSVLRLCTALVILATLILSGCEFRRISVNEPIRHEHVAFVVPGKTTLQEVVTKLGAPDEVTGSEGQLVFRYRFGATKAVKVNFGWILRVWSPVAPSMSWTQGIVGTEALQVTFDPDWVVQNLAFSLKPRATGFNPWPF